MVLDHVATPRLSLNTKTSVFRKSTYDHTQCFLSYCPKLQNNQTAFTHDSNLLHCTHRHPWWVGTRCRVSLTHFAFREGQKL